MEPTAKATVAAKAKRSRRLDIRVEDHGSVVLLRPVTRAGRAWIGEYVSQGGYQPYWPTVVCEPRYLSDVVAGATADGLAVR